MGIRYPRVNDGTSIGVDKKIDGQVSVMIMTGLGMKYVDRGRNDYEHKSVKSRYQR